MEVLITYQEYCEVLSITPLAIVPQDFDNNQIFALTTLYNQMTQIHLFPISKDMFNMLRIHYKKTFLLALCEQIRFIDTHKSLYDDSYISASSFTVGEFSKGPINSSDIKSMFNNVCVKTRHYLLQLGWLYSSLDKYLPYEYFYEVAS